MKKQILIPVLLLVFLSIACSLGGGAATATEEPEIIIRPTNTEVNPTLPPAPTDLPPTEAPKQEPTATEAPACPVTGTYTFDEISECWPETPDELFSVTTVSDLRKVYSGVQNGMYEFEITVPEEMYLYAFNNYNLYQEVILEADLIKIEPSVNKNGFVLACHVNEDGWYEARMESGGIYHIYQYETFKKAQGDNPYTTISKGGTNAIRVGVDRVNNMRFECMKDSLTLIINGEEVFYEKMSLNSGGGIGIGVASTWESYPVHIGFDYLTVLTP